MPFIKNTKSTQQNSKLSLSISHHTQIKSCTSNWPWSYKWPQWCCHRQ